MALCQKSSFNSKRYSRFLLSSFIYVVVIPTSVGSWKKQENSRETSTSASLTTLKPLTVWVTKNCGKFLKRWEYQTTLTCLLETHMPVKKQQLEPDKQQTGSKLGKDYVKAVYCHSAYLTYYCKMPYWMKHKLKSRLLGVISITSDNMQMTALLWQKLRRNERTS